jgi:hypothetical protein
MTQKENLENNFKLTASVAHEIGQKVFVAQLFTREAALQAFSHQFSVAQVFNFQSDEL